MLEDVVVCRLHRRIPDDCILWMLHMELTSQILLGRITAFFLGIMIFLISMNRPRKGAVSVRLDSFPSVWDPMMSWEEPA